MVSTGQNYLPEIHELLAPRISPNKKRFGEERNDPTDSAKISYAGIDECMTQTY